MWIRVGLAVALLAGAWLAPMAALGRVEAESGHSKNQTYNAALRYLRVDLGYEVTEKDAKAAYLLFQYTPPGRREAAQGSIEIVETQKKVRVFIQLPQMPRYHEQVLSDGLMRKLRTEYGQPPEKKPEPPPDVPPPDGGT